MLDVVHVDMGAIVEFIVVVLIVKHTHNYSSMDMLATVVDSVWALVMGLNPG